MQFKGTETYSFSDNPFKFYPGYALFESRRWNEL